MDLLYLWSCMLQHIAISCLVKEHTEYSHAQQSPDQSFQKPILYSWGNCETDIFVCCFVILVHKFDQYHFLATVSILLYRNISWQKKWWIQPFNDEVNFSSPLPLENRQSYGSTVHIVLYASTYCYILLGERIWPAVLLPPAIHQSYSLTKSTKPPLKRT